MEKSTKRSKNLEGEGGSDLFWKKPKLKLHLLKTLPFAWSSFFLFFISRNLSPIIWQNCAIYIFSLHRIKTRLSGKVKVLCFVCSKKCYCLPALETLVNPSRAHSIPSAKSTLLPSHAKKVLKKVSTTWKSEVKFTTYSICVHFN